MKIQLDVDYRGACFEEKLLSLIIKDYYMYGEELNCGTNTTEFKKLATLLEKFKKGDTHIYITKEEGNDLQFMCEEVIKLLNDFMKKIN